MNAHTSYAWQRFTPAQRLARWLVYVGCLLAVVVSIKSVDIIPEFLYDAPEQMQDLLVRMWPIEWAFYITPQNLGAQTVHQALMDSLAVAFLSTALGLVLATPVAPALFTLFRRSAKLPDPLAHQAARSAGTASMPRIVKTAMACVLW